MKRFIGALVILAYVVVGLYVALRPATVTAKGPSPADIYPGSKVVIDGGTSILKESGSGPWICACPDSERSCYCQVD